MQKATPFARSISFAIDVVLITFIRRFVFDHYTHSLPKYYPQIIGVGIYLFYFFINEYLFRKTVGKAIIRIEVVSPDTNKNASNKWLNNILLRTICRLIPFDFLSVFFTPNDPLMWHDRFSKTIVVNTQQET